MSTGLEEVSMNPQQKREFVALLGVVLGLVALLMVAGPGPAYRMQWLSLHSAFTGLRWGAWLGIAAVVVSLIGAWLARPGRARSSFGLALVRALAGAVAFGMPLSMMM